jgi:N-acetylglucosamine malate deacetylase 1
MKLDILAFGAHPDDVELGAGGTISKEVALGRKVGIIDLTRGELGTRGTPEQRDSESANASKIMGVEFRANLGFRDCFFADDEAHQLEILRFIRFYRPEIVICNAISDRHIDHGKGSNLVSKACFLSGLLKISSKWENSIQESWRPKAVYHFIQDRYHKPDFVVDISSFMEIKMEAVKAYKSQFYDPDSLEPGTLISSKEFLEFLVARAIEMGRPMGFQYAEGFVAERSIGVNTFFNLI